MQNKISTNPLLQQKRIDRDNKLLINPDNVFWALLSGKKADADKKVHSLYTKFQKKLDTSMKDFRFKTDLNSVYINPTDLCNADCPYCYVPASIRKRGRQMDEAQLTGVLKKIDSYFRRKQNKTATKPIIIYHASEPLLVKDMLFSSMVKFSKKFHFGIQTNAILLEKKDVEFLKSHKVSVGISLDSFDSQINDRTRKTPQGSNYNKAIQAIDWFNGYEGLNVITTVTKYNVKNLSAIVSFLHSKGVSCLLLNPVRASRSCVVNLRPAQETLTTHFIKAVEEAIELSKKSKRRIIIGNFSNIVLGITAPLARRLMCDITPCGGGGRCFFAVTASGDMIPCGEFTGLPEFCGGNIFHSSIEKAISSQAFKKVRARIVEKIAECDVCVYRNICGAPCPAEVYSLSRNLNTISPYCEFYKKIIKYAFKLIAEDK
ncbi:MAG: peptide-modifying radical SAM enzyme CbpB, partial [Candidatus Omnitrophota bacterium]